MDKLQRGLGLAMSLRMMQSTVRSKLSELDMNVIPFGKPSDNIMMPCH